uniref:Uncharacterized protein n=1 Tax=Romanomermis culicivorax TaxID=13658 RepID=A0A915LBV8_ROMCU
MYKRKYEQCTQKTKEKRNTYKDKYKKTNFRNKCGVDNTVVFIPDNSDQSSFSKSFVTQFKATFGKNFDHSKRISTCLKNYVGRLSAFVEDCMKNSLKDDHFGQLSIKMEFAPLLMDYVYIREVYPNYYFDLIFKRSVCGNDITSVNVKSAIDCLADLFDKIDNSCQNMFDELVEQEALKSAYCSHNCMHKLGEYCGNMSSLLISTTCECWRYVEKLYYTLIDPDLENCLLGSQLFVQYYRALIAHEMSKRLCSMTTERSKCT